MLDHAMDGPAQTAAKCLHRLAELSGRLATREIVVTYLQVTSSCWELQAQKGHTAARVVLDGIEGYVTLESSPIRSDGRANEWKREGAKAIVMDGGDEIFGFVEDYLKRTLSVTRVLL